MGQRSDGQRRSGDARRHNSRRDVPRHGEDKIGVRGFRVIEIRREINVKRRVVLGFVDIRQAAASDRRDFVRNDGHCRRIRKLADGVIRRSDRQRERRPCQGSGIRHGDLSVVVDGKRTIIVSGNNGVSQRIAVHFNGGHRANRRSVDHQ